MFSKKVQNKALKMVKDHPELRLGQAIMNTLNQYYPSVYNQIADTEFDCFYLEERVSACLSKLDTIDPFPCLHNSVDTWMQGHFVNQKQYSHWTSEQKSRANSEESCKVRPSPLGNAICVCINPEDAKWIASRLNIAAKLENMLMSGKCDIADGNSVAMNLRSLISSCKDV